jgi:hypothetical protein
VRKVKSDMPAMLDDPDSPTIYRTSGVQPYPDPKDRNPQLPPDIVARQVTLRDRITIATLIPFSSVSQVPASLLAYLCDQLNREIEKGDTYPMIEPMLPSQFGPYWFSNFAAVMLLGDIAGVEEVVEDKDWSQECLGSFYIKPNYPGRSSHVCNGAFLVTDASRNRGVGRLMGEGYLEWAPKLVNCRRCFFLGGVLFGRRERKKGELTGKKIIIIRDTPTPSSISSTRPTWRHVASGMPWASSVSVRSRDVVT